MNGALLLSLAQNAAVLVALLVLVHFAGAGREDESRLRQAGLGSIIGAVAIALVLTGHQTPAGMLYDTRTVLLSLTGLLFSPLTTAIATAVAVTHRIQLAGPVMGPGILALAVAAGLGMAARTLQPRPVTTLSWLQLYTFGMLVHVAILSIPPLLSLQPEATGQPVEFLPVLLLYPPLLACSTKLVLWLRGLQVIEQRARDKAHWLELASELKPLGLAEHDLLRQRMTLSPGMAHQFGFPRRHQNTAMDVLLNQVHPGDRQRIEQETWLMVENTTPARPAELSVDYRLKDGEESWEWMRCLSRVTDWDEAGRPTRILMAQMSIDKQRRLVESRQKLQREMDRVTAEASESRLALLSALEDRQITEQALRESQRLLDEMSDLARIIGWEKDLTTGEKRFTPGIYQMTEQPGSDEITFTQGDAFLHPDDRARIAQAVRECIADASKSVDQELRFVHPDGTISWARSVGTVAWEDGHPVRLRGSLQDITPIKEAQAEQQKSYDMLVKMAAQVPGAIFQFQVRRDGTAAFPWISSSVRELLELEPEELREDAQPIYQRIHADELVAIQQAIAESRRNLTPFNQEFRVVLPGQGVQWRRCDSVPERLEDGTTLWHGIITDITQRKAVEERLQLSSLVYEHSSEAMMIADPDARIVDINDAFTHITGYDRNHVLGQSAWDLYLGLESGAFYRAVQRELLKTGHWHGELRSRRRNSEVFYQRLTINAAYDNAGQIHHWVCQFSDITEQKRAERVIWEQAHFDPLTQLPNRRMFQDRLAQEIKHARRTGFPLALLFMDLDNFKEVNDTLGHESGDQLLREATTRIQACVRETDTVARLGGDEFIVIFNNLESDTSVDQVCRRLLEVFSSPFTLGSETLHVSVSIGITLYPEDAEDMEGLLKNADQAMYAAKREGRNCFRYFTPQMQEAAQRRMTLIRELRTAQQQEQFRLVYQPIVHLPSGRIRKVEALVRWHHPQRGVVSPGEFIPLAEETGMIAEIGDTVFRQATAQLHAWRQRGFQELIMGINLSPAQLNTREDLLHHYWAPHLKALGLPGSSIILEITEGMLLDPRPRVREQLLASRQAGIHIALDDFGTGYSSLAYLKQFDIDFLKIDRSFIAQLAPDNEDLALCEAMIVMAHKLGIEVVAEGVESRQQLTLLQQAGCDYAQGFFLARPMEAAEAEAMIAEFRL